MSCDETRRLVSDRLDGADREPAALEAHLAACPECRRAAAELEVLERLLAEVPPPEPPPGYLEAARRRLGPRLASARRARQLRRRVVGWSAAAAAVLLGAGLVWGIRGDEGAAPTPQVAEPGPSLRDPDVLVALDRLQARLGGRGDAETLDLVETASLVVHEAAALEEAEPGGWSDLSDALRETRFPERFGTRARAVEGRDAQVDRDLQRVALLLDGLAREGAG